MKTKFMWKFNATYRTEFDLRTYILNMDNQIKRKKEFFEILKFGRSKIAEKNNKRLSVEENKQQINLYFRY